MPKDPAKFEDWAQEQTTKSLFFHQKLHEWGLLEVARAIEAFDGSRVEWNLPRPLYIRACLEPSHP
jgi:hypothetical protein